ncbi:MAG: outer membrane beta-barrel protein, partial [Bacteroidia bacterium]
SVNFAKNWSAEINVFYRSVNIAGYVVNIPIFTADGGIRKTFADGKGAIRLSCGDIFHSERYRNTEKFKEINFTALFYSDSQRLRISLSWKLGKSQYQREEKQKSAQEELNRIKTN